MTGSGGEFRAPEHKLQLGTSWGQRPRSLLLLGSTQVTAQHVDSCQSLADPSYWHLLLFSDLVEEFHVLYHGICWSIHSIVSVPKYCGGPWCVAT